MIKNLFPRELSVLIGIFLVAALFVYWPVWSTATNIDEYADKYSKSQYVLGTKSTALVSDSELYVYAAHAYLRGEDPTTVNFEHPPLAKYLYGVSLRLFENVYAINLLLFPLLLVVIYHFSALLIDNKWHKLGVVALFAVQPIIFSQLQHILLDIPLTLFVLLLFIALHRTWKNAVTKYMIAGLLLGVIASIKYPFPFIFVPTAVLVLVAWKENKLPLIVVSFVTAGLAYICSYIMFFYHGHTLLDLIAFEKYRFSWWVGDRTIPKFLIFPNLFFGQHKAWWDNSIQYTKEWNIMLPAIFITFIASLTKFKKEFWFLIISGFGIGMLLVFGLGAASALRYLTLLLPFWLTTVFSVTETLFIKQEKKVLSKKVKR